MSDEQIIYLDPNDELTKVRERLEGIAARRVIVIVPQQTQLRSHVGWRLLHARTREMGKEVLVISADRQIRAVAKAAGFRVAESADSSAPSKGRSGSRPSRSSQDSKTARQQRMSPSRRPFEAREAREVRRGDQPSLQTHTAEEPLSQNTWPEAGSRDSQVGETASRQDMGTNSPPFHIEDDEFDHPYEFRIEPSQASSFPLSPRGQVEDDDDDEQDQILADYETSRRIREAAELGKSESPTAFEPASSAPAFAEHGIESSDPFDALEDRSSVPLPEQRGATHVYEMDEDIPDISDVPTLSQEAHEVEFLGDQDDFVGTQQIPVRQWPDMFSDEPDVEVPPPRVYGTRPRGSRSGKLQRRPAPNLDDADSLAPIEDRSTAIPIVPVQPAPVPPARSTGGLAAASASRQAPSPPTRPRRNVTTPPAPQQPRVTPQASRGRAGTRVAPSAARQRSRRGGRVLTALLICLLLLFLGAVGLFYFGTSANVTITVPAKTVDLSAIKLSATTNPQDKAHNTAASELLTYTASATGNGTATGTTKQGNSQATGTAIFTNKGTQQVDIPTGTTVSTSGGTGSVVFLTIADALIPGNSSIPIPIQAQSQGPQGNVRAGTITEITADGYTKIAQANNVPTTTLNLNVTNTAPTSGGGAANTPAATKNDIAALTLALHQKIQAQVKSWLATQLHKNDLYGTPIPDVLGSANPLPDEVLTQAPPVGQALTSATISGTLTVQVKVIVVRAAAILIGAQQQLNTYALSQRPAYMLTSPDTVQITKIASSSPKDGSSLTITLNATGQAVPQVNLSDLSNSLTGKTVDQAKGEINSGGAGIQQVEDTQIIVTPSFLSLMPFRPEHIHISIQPGPGPAKKAYRTGKVDKTATSPLECYRMLVV